MISREFIERVYPELPFGGFSRVDGTIPLLSRAHALAEGAKVVLEIGCGRGKARDDSSNYRRKLHDFRAPGRTVIGIDVDPVAATNPLIDEYRRIGSDFKWPVEDASIDFAFSDYVLEHVGNPEAYFAELRRVLAPGGLFLWTTPGLGAAPEPIDLHDLGGALARAGFLEPVLVVDRYGSAYEIIHAAAFAGLTPKTAGGTTGGAPVESVVAMDAIGRRRDRSDPGGRTP